VEVSGIGLDTGLDPRSSRQYSTFKVPEFWFGFPELGLDTGFPDLGSQSRLFELEGRAGFPGFVLSEVF